MTNQVKLNISNLMKCALYLLNLLLFLLLLLPALSINIPLWWLDNLFNLQLQWTLLALILIVVNIRLGLKLGLLSVFLYLPVITYNQLPLYRSSITPLPMPTPLLFENALLKAPLLPTKSLQMIKLKIAQLNLSYQNPNIKNLLPLLGSPEFDLLVLQEASDKQHENIKALTLYYPYSFGLSETLATPSGMAILSRWPIVEKKIHDLGYKSGLLLEVLIQHLPTNTAIQLYALHPSSPRSKKLWQQRNALLRYAAKQVATSPFPYQVVIGDFNSSPWSTSFKYFQENSLLKNSAQGFGYIPSWSYSKHILINMISSVYIDHCLISQSFSVLSKNHQRVSGSDHLLLFTELILNPSSQ